MGLPIRKSHENSQVLKLHGEFLTDGPRYAAPPLPQMPSFVLTVNTVVL